MAKGLITIVRKWLTKLLWLVSIIVILFVLLVSVVKLILPYWLDDKDKVIELVETQIGGEFNYQQLVVDWTRFRPTIYLEELSWENDDHTLRVESSRNTIELNLWKSLIDGYLKTESIEINGTNVTYTLPDSSAASSTDFSLDSIRRSLSMNPEILQQRKISIRDLALTLRNQGNSRSLVAPMIRYERMGHDRQLIIDTRGELFSSGRFVIETEGQPFEGSNATDLYVSLEDTDIKSLAQFLNLKQQFPVDLINLELWLNYEGDKPVSGYSRFIASGDQSKVAELEGAIRFDSDNEYFKLFSDRFKLVQRDDDNNLRSFDSDFLLQKKKQSQGDEWSVSVDNIPISYLLTVIKPFLLVEHIEWANGLDPKGHINHFELLALHNEESFKAQKADIELSNLVVKEYQQIPALEINQLQIADENAQWRVKLNSYDSQFAKSDWLKAPVVLEQLVFDGLVELDETININIDELIIKNQDLNIKAQGLVSLNEGDSGKIDTEVALYAEAKDLKIAELHKYWPRQGMKKKAVDYLDMSLKGGVVERAKLVWRGGVEAFPYQDESGQFYVEAKVRDALFKFDPEWPQAEQLNATAIFDNDEMRIVAETGQLLGSTVNSASATIDSFSNDISMLTIHVDGNVSSQSYAQLHQNSPLKDKLGEAVTDFVFAQPINPKLEITIPLGNDVPASIKGSIPLNGHTISYKDFPVKLRQVGGFIHFTDDGAFSEALHASLWGNSFAINVKVDEFTNDSDLVTIDANSDFAINNIFTSQKIESPLTINGASQLIVRYRIDQEEKQSLIVRTDLKGTEIIGPDWLSKEKAETSDVLITLFESAGKINSRAIYRNTISSRLAFSTDSMNDLNGVIALGNLATQNIQAPEQGVAIRGQFNEIKSYDWINSLQFKGEQSFKWPRWIDHIDVRTPLFDIAGQKLHEVRLTDEVLAGEYLRFKVTAEEGQGSLTLYEDGRKRVQIDELDIKLEPFSKLSESEISLDKKALYDWQLECASCRINGIDTGFLTLVTQKAEGGVTIQGDSKIEGLLSAYLEGSWLGDVSNVKINFSSPNAGRLLQRWGYGDGIRDTSTNGSLDLSWSGGWHKFELNQSNGTFNVSTGQGVVRELSDRQARVFSLLSLQSLRRRLSLDFSDLFEDGFFYDSINGRFTIKKGIVYSENVSINGATAEVTITGYTDLVNNKVDQNVLVIPKLGSSLPVLAGWAIEPTTGLIMLLINKIFEPVLDVVVSIEYKIKGDLDNPEVIELDKKSKEIVIPDEELLEEAEDQPIMDSELINQEQSPEQDSQSSDSEQSAIEKEVQALEDDRPKQTREEDGNDK
ncbi:YhdP family protein [Kangiella koreensis]|uniref:Putative membrane protein n=1 Tax=Kangiella koreensis (strain DSM 16069 / JCM 12317 / KCTC 12182 / SW-125) TaxID=523791 RepID=C7R9G7_KANKD|nr:YhdP family protein [Kangiella koreensis]ACV26058.1 putative membrane protein [Kangiella koreensis DSM 16069]